MVSGSLRDPDAPPPTSLELVPSTAGFDAYGDAFDLVDLGRQVLNSLVVAAFAVPLSRARRRLGRLRARAAAARVHAPPLVAASLAALDGATDCTAGPAVRPLPRAGRDGHVACRSSPRPCSAMSPLYVLLYCVAFRACPRELYDACAVEGLTPFADVAPDRDAARAAGHRGSRRARVRDLAGRTSSSRSCISSIRDLYTVPLGTAVAGGPRPHRLPGVPRRRGRCHRAGARRRSSWRSACSSHEHRGAGVARALTLCCCSPLALAARRGLPAATTRGRCASCVFGEPEELQAYRDVVAAYRESEPDRPVELVEASDRSDLLARLATSFAGGAPPDVFLVNYRFYGQFAAKDVLEPLGTALAALRRVHGGRLLPAGARCLPLAWASSCACRRTSRASPSTGTAHCFAATECQAPRPGWSWNDLVVTATAVDPRRGGESSPRALAIPRRPASVPPSTASASSRRSSGIAPFVWSSGGELVDDDIAPTRFTLDTPEAPAALRAFFDLRLARGRPDRRGGRGGGRRVALRQRPARDAPLLAALDDDIPLDRRARLGRRAAAGARQARPAFCTPTRTASTRDVRPHRRRVAIRRVRARAGGAAHHGADRAHGALAWSRSRARTRFSTRRSRRRAPASSSTRSPWSGACRRSRRGPRSRTPAAGILENGFYLGTPVEEVVAELDGSTRPLFARGETP